MGNNNGDEYSGYVPDFFPDQHWGDYVMLDIDTETGKITNWRKTSDETVQKVFDEAKKEINPFD